MEGFKALWRNCLSPVRVGLSLGSPFLKEILWGEQKGYSDFCWTLKQDESWFKEWSLIPGRGAKFVKVGPSRHTGRDTNHHGVGADPTMDDFESRQTTPWRSPHHAKDRQEFAIQICIGPIDSVNSDRLILIYSHFLSVKSHLEILSRRYLVKQNQCLTGSAKYFATSEVRSANNRGSL